MWTFDTIRLLAASEAVKQKIDSQPFLPRLVKTPSLRVGLDTFLLVNCPIFPSGTVRKNCYWFFWLCWHLTWLRSICIPYSFLLCYFSENKKRDHPPSVRKILFIAPTSSVSTVFSLPLHPFPSPTPSSVSPLPYSLLLRLLLVKFSKLTSFPGTDINLISYFSLFRITVPVESNVLSL